MESLSKLSQWLPFAKSRFGLTVTLLTWPETFGSKLIDIECKMPFEGSDFSGRGSHRTVEGAFARAVAELIERISIVSSGTKDALGVAAHHHIAGAKRRAINELVERVSCEDNFIRCGPVVLESSFEIKGMLVHRFLVSNKVAVVLVDGRRSCFNHFELAIGHGAGQTSEEALSHAEVEGFRIAAWLTLTNPIFSEDNFVPGKFWLNGSVSSLAKNSALANFVRSSFFERIGSNIKKYNNHRGMLTFEIPIPGGLEADWLKVVGAKFV